MDFFTLLRPIAIHVIASDDDSVEKLRPEVEFCHIAGRHPGRTQRHDIIAGDVLLFSCTLDRGAVIRLTRVVICSAASAGLQ